MKNTERFSNRVKDYVSYRPHYPTEIITFLKKQIYLNKDWVIADIGSGTGISTELFLHNGNTVYAVEPNKEMRTAAEEAFKNNRNFISINAPAEATTLPDKSVNLIIAAQAFHWFDKWSAKKEFMRIAQPDGYLALIWNERKQEQDFHHAYEQMLSEFAPAYKNECRQNIDEVMISEFFSPNPWFFHSFPNVQHFDFEGLKGRLLSSSYAPLKDHPQYRPILQRLQQIFDRFNVEGKVEFEYTCKLFYGKINP